MEKPDVYAIRKKNFRLLVEEAGNARRLAIALGWNESRVSQLKGDGRSSRISEKVAETVERSLGKPAGWLSQPDHYMPDTALLAEIAMRLGNARPEEVARAYFEAMRNKK